MHKLSFPPCEGIGFEVGRWMDLYEGTGIHLGSEANSAARWMERPKHIHPSKPHHTHSLNYVKLCKQLIINNL